MPSCDLKVTGLEMCATRFNTAADCKQWLMANGYGGLYKWNGFVLRKTKKTQILTKEIKRVVWHWEQEPVYKSIKFFRPIPEVCIGITDGERFTPEELPAKLPATIEHERKKQISNAARTEKLRALKRKADDGKEKPEKPEKKPKSKSSRKKKKDLNGLLSEPQNLEDLAKAAIKAEPLIIQADVTSKGRSQ